MPKVMSDPGIVCWHGPEVDLEVSYDDTATVRVGSTSNGDLWLECSYANMQYGPGAAYHGEWQKIGNIYESQER